MRIALRVLQAFPVGQHALAADEIRFVRGRLVFGGPNANGNPAPFPSVVLVYRKAA